MLLAGGQGSRLGVLTSNQAKPAVPFGGKYRIIDFAMSNCVNSGVDTVGVLTQYQPLKLNKHIGIGTPWDLDRRNGGVTVLAPHIKTENGEWFTGTADAIFQNLDFIDQYNPEYVLILGGDHIYKMDYSRMLDFHKLNKCDVSIAALTVPWDEASRFGVMNIHEDNRIYEFEEKPPKPKSNFINMGIYIFRWDLLRDALERDNKIHSDSDFGKHVLPMMLKEGRRMFAYPFSGYWKDVGTIESYWMANMDLIQTVPDFNLYENFDKIYTHSDHQPPLFTGSNTEVKASIISEGCEVLGSH
jgi:glucose-1-phosphate adenylyltransferase